MTVVRVHQDNTGDTFFGSVGTIENVGSTLQNALVDADISETSDERVGRNLEGEADERFVVGGFADIGFTVLGSLFARNIERRGEVSDNRVKERLNAFVLVSRAAENGEELNGQDRLTNGLFDQFFVRLFSFEDHHHEVIVEGSELFEQFGTIAEGFFFEFFRAIGDRRSVILIVIVDISLHRDEVDAAFKVAFTANRALNRSGVDAEKILKGVQANVEVGTGSVHLVAEDDTRNVEFIGLAPNGFGLGLDAIFGVEDRHRAVEDAEGAFNFNGEVDVPRSVDDIEAVAFPEAGRGGRGDRDTTFLFLDHPVHGGSAFMNFADLVGTASVIKNALGRRGFARVDVRHNPDVTDMREIVNCGLLDFVFVFSHWDAPSITSGNARKLCWLRPSCGRPASS